MTRVSACTVITRNRLAHARVLAESFLEHHPEGKVTALVLDDLEHQITHEPFEILRPDDLEIDSHEFLRMAGIYDALELSCAMKPWVISHVLRQDDVAVYLDSDVKVFSPIAEVVTLAHEHSIVLTPHLLHPLRHEHEVNVDGHMLRAGAFNLGFLAVSAAAGPFLAWWKARLARHCVNLPEQGLFVDQRWIDLVPGYFDHVVLRTPGYNVLFWSLLAMRIDGGLESFTIEGDPLRTFHFAGYRPEAPHVLTRWIPPHPAIRLSEQAARRTICSAYSGSLRYRGYERCSALPYAYSSLPTGMALDATMRHAYRQELLRTERDQDSEPPNPFGDPLGFLAWLREPPNNRGQARSISRYLTTLHHERPGVSIAFPNLETDGERFLQWLAAGGRGEGLVAGFPDPAGKSRPTSSGEHPSATEFAEPAPTGPRLLRPFTARRGELNTAVREGVAELNHRLASGEHRLEALLTDERPLR